MSSGSREVARKPSITPTAQSAKARDKEFADRARALFAPLGGIRMPVSPATRDTEIRTRPICATVLGERLPATLGPAIAAASIAAHHPGVVTPPGSGNSFAKVNGPAAGPIVQPSCTLDG